MYNLKFMDENNPDDWLKDLPVRAENVAFAPEEILTCAKCDRPNPPTRLNCFYCGAELSFSESQKRYLTPKYRKLDLWEKGFNLIHLPQSTITENAKVSAAAKFLITEEKTFVRMLKANAALPLARVESSAEAELIRSRLLEFGIESLIVSDESLADKNPPRRLRGIEFFDDKLILILFNQNQIIEISPDDLSLIVAGAVFRRKIEATEKHNKKGDNQLLDTIETASDESLMDIYSRHDSHGFRIHGAGFDFSSLEAEKQLLAKDNMKKLGERLRQVAPQANYLDDYVSNRIFLANIWETDQRTDSQGLKREGFGKFNMENVTTISNLSQFTKYSRLQRHLL